MKKGSLKLLPRLYYFCKYNSEFSLCYIVIFVDIRGVLLFVYIIVYSYLAYS